MKQQTKKVKQVKPGLWCGIIGTFSNFRKSYNNENIADFNYISEKGMRHFVQSINIDYRHEVKFF